MSPKTNHFKFLDSFRGLMALLVIVHHSNCCLGYKGNYTDFVSIITKVVSALGMSGFFLLSSFLLTYRLYDEMDKITGVDYKEYALVIGKYFIRRFMRIYPGYFVYCTFFCFVSVLSTGIFSAFNHSLIF